MRRGLLVPAACVMLAGCVLHYDTRSLGVPVTMAAPAGTAVAGDTFAVTSHAVWLFWGLTPAKAPSLQETLAGQLGAGAAVQNLAVHSRARWSDVLLSVLTLGIVSTNTVTFSGVVTRTGP